MFLIVSQTNLKDECLVNWIINGVDMVWIAVLIKIHKANICILSLLIFSYTDLLLSFLFMNKEDIDLNIIPFSIFLNINTTYVKITLLIIYVWSFMLHFIFSSPDPLSVRRPSVNFSHFNQLLWSHWANLNQNLVEWSLDGPLPKLCLVIPTSNQDGRISQNELKF